MILKLEKKIVAESISKITSIEKENGIAKYKIYFEDTISNPVLVDSAKIEDLDKLRENSFFSIYMIPQKTPYSLISQNVTFFLTS